MSAIAKLARWAAETSDDHGDLAYARATAAVTDTVACMIAGANDPSTVAAYDAVAGWGEGAATVIGTASRLPVPFAALVNGTAANALDYDDFDVPAASHPSAAIIPALFALGEQRNASGAAFLDAYIVGLEVHMRIGEAVNMSHFHLGWHSTATIGTFGATVACARLMGLDAAGIANALGIATSMSAGYKCQLGSTAIHLHTGFAAQNGVLAAGLAAAGATGAADALDGEWSFLTLLAGPGANGFDGPLAKLGKPLAIEEHGLHVKSYPCCSYINRTIDGILELRAADAFTAADIASVTTTIPGRNMELLKFPEPHNVIEARFSMHYCVAAALARGALTIADFTEDAVARSEVWALLPLVEMRGHPITPNSSDVTAVEPDVIAIRFKDGREVTKTVEHARGSPTLPLSDAELMVKFDDCAAGVLSPADAGAAKTSLARLAALDDLGDLAHQLRACLDAPPRASV